MVASVLAFHLDNGSQQAGFHCLLSQARVEFRTRALKQTFYTSGSTVLGESSPSAGTTAWVAGDVGVGVSNTVGLLSVLPSS